MVSARRIYQAWYAAFHPGFTRMPDYLDLSDEEKAKWEHVQKFLVEFESHLSHREVIPGLGSMLKRPE